ncbi:MAG TPA: ferritin-like domain-containing protein [Candidatus Acidoferrales bacterium]|nr:ferritin-like domain-containing protein [Candidatus Acidoferrales bacterium]
MKLENLHSLLVEELQDLYSAENQIIEALPDIIEEASSPDLKGALQQHLEETRGQVRRLDQIFSQIPNVKKDGKTCKGMKGIIKDGQDLLDTDAEPEVLDAGMIAATQRVEHYEIAGYGTVRTYAQLLGRKDWAQLLEQTLNEEKQADQKLNQLAGHINVEARAA